MKSKFFPSGISTVPSLILSSSILWLFLFRHFLLGQYALLDDAVVYYEHVKFYIDQISRGVYPLWDPSREWGVPNEFFLLRFGPFNPLIFVIPLLNKIGLSYGQSYFFFLGGYYLLGMMGFYLLAKAVFQDKLAAFTAYLLLMFSSFSTLLINSFIILEFTPIVWFFYFLITFGFKPTELSFLGMTYCLMLIFAMYVPFYFLIILLSFLILFSVFYFPALKIYIKNLMEFFSQNKTFLILCLFLVILSIMPGWILYNQARQGEFILPGRHVASDFHNKVSMLDGQKDTDNSLQVAPQTTIRGGIVSVNFINELFFNLNEFQPGTLYFPIFVHVLLLLGCVVVNNKRIILLTTWAFMTYLMGLYDAGPLYEFLYKHIFIFRYVRNFQFFLWLVLLPLYILICVEQFRLFLSARTLTRFGRNVVLTVLVLGGIVFTCFLLSRGKLIIVSSYIVLGLSLIFLVMKGLSQETGLNKRHETRLLWFILLLVVIQPLEVYGYLDKNTIKARGEYRYDVPYLIAPLSQGQRSKRLMVDTTNLDKDPYLFDVQYLNTPWGKDLRSHVDPEILDEYLRFKFVVFDHIKWIKSDQEIDWSWVRKNMAENQNMALVTAQEPLKLPELKDTDSFARVITENSKEFKLLSFDVNWIKVKTNFLQPRFLVYNSLFYSQWNAFIDDNKTTLYRANVAFKGLWIPAGEHIVDFRFGSPWFYGLHIVLLGIFMAVFTFLIFLWWQTRFSSEP